MDRALKPRIRVKVGPDKICCGCGLPIQFSFGTSWIAHGPDCLKIKVPDLRPAMRRQIKGALKAAISDHGPIDKNLIGSVLKRLESQPVYRSILDGRAQEKGA